MSGIERAVELVRELRDAVPAGWADDQATESKRQRLRDEAAAFLRDAREVEELPETATGFDEVVLSREEFERLRRTRGFTSFVAALGRPVGAAQRRRITLERLIERANAACAGQEFAPRGDVLALLRRIVKEAEFTAGPHSTPDGWTDTPLGRVLCEAESLVLSEVEELPGDGQRSEEMAERMAVIEKLAGFLADPRDDRECDCAGEGIDYEGDEWDLCECVLKKIGAISIDAAFVVHDDDRCHYMRAREAQRLDEAMECLSNSPDYHGGGVMRVRDTEREHEPSIVEQRMTKALQRIYAIAPIGSDAADIARRAIHGIEEPGTPENRRLDHTSENLIAAREAADGAEEVIAEWKASAEEAGQHVEVLAKALDQFFRQTGAHERQGSHAWELHNAVTPTLQALGYPKEAGS